MVYLRGLGIPGAWKWLCFGATSSGGRDDGHLFWIWIFLIPVLLVRAAGVKSTHHHTQFWSDGSWDITGRHICPKKMKQASQLDPIPPLHQPPSISVLQPQQDAKHGSAPSVFVPTVLSFFDQVSPFLEISTKILEWGRKGQQERGYKAAAVLIA